MDQYVTGAAIKALREAAKLTQSQLAERLSVSDKTVSKWETGRSYPDITLLEPIAAALRVSVAELLSGRTVVNTNVSANMRRCHFYVCPLCGNVLHSMGQAAVSCHGVTLPPLEAEEAEGSHAITVEAVEDEYLVTVNHPMTRQHHLLFLAAVSDDRLQLIRLYPEGPAQTRIQHGGVRAVYACCNRDGLFKQDL